jgi:hypothetical protein
LYLILPGRLPRPRKIGPVTLVISVKLVKNVKMTKVTKLAKMTKMTGWIIPRFWPWLARCRPLLLSSLRRMG